nr:unnamed protein product [Digitaria exilis]
MTSVFRRVAMPSGWASATVGRGIQRLGRCGPNRRFRGTLLGPPV